MFDVVFRGGQVFDSARACWKQADVAVTGRRIEAVGPLDREAGRVELDCTGKLVCPGLMDSHLHLFTQASDEGIPPDLCLLPNGITSAVDGGTAGVSTYEAFHQINVQNSYASIKAYLNVSSLGMLHARVFENTRVEDYEPERILETVRKHPGEIIALKLRYSLDLDPHMPVQALERCLEIAEQAGLPLVVHVTNPPVDMGVIAAALRPGDVFCHCFQGKGDTILDAGGRVKPAVWEAKRRGVLFDACNGTNNYCHDVARAALAEGFLPDFISTDGSHVFHSFYKPKCFALPYILSKYIALGMSVEDVLERATTRVAKFAGWERKGVLEPGYDADIAVLSVEKRDVSFEDFKGDAISGQMLLLPQLTMKAGTIVYRNLSFT